MKALGRAAVLAVLVLAMTACASRTELMRRYKAVEGGYPGSDAAAVDVSVFSVSAPDGSPKGVLDLSDRGQEKFIEVVGAKASMAELRSALATPFTRARKPGGDLGRIKRRIVLSVIDKDFNPADRLDRIEVSLTLPNDRTPDGQSCAMGGCLDARFTNWSLLETQYGNVDLGKATATQSRSVEATLSVLPPQVREVTGLSITPKVSRDLSEELAVKRRYVTLAGEITPTRLRVLQQGATGIDLVGTSQIDVVVDLGQRRFARIYDFTMDDKKQPGLTSYPQLQAELACNLDVAVSGSYRIRSVVNGAGDDTSVEGDDKVRYTTRTFGGPDNRFTLLDSEEIGSATFVMLTQQGWPLQVLQPNLADSQANYEPLLFASVDEAIDFRRWIVGQVRANGVGPEVSGYRFKIRKSDIEQIPATPELAAGLRIIPEQRAKCQSS